MALETNNPMVDMMPSPTGDTPPFIAAYGVKNDKTPKAEIATKAPIIPNIMASQGIILKIASMAFAGNGGNCL